MSTDCNGRYVYLNPRRGAQIAVAEAARNVVCAGGEPLGVTNCLNFGNPYKPEVYWQFSEAVGGMGDACRAFGTPVTGGNVSFYNESPEGAIFPTPTIGMVGLVADVEAHTTTAAFQAPGDAAAARLAGRLVAHRRHRGREFLATLHGRTEGDAPHLDLDEEKTVQATVLAAIRAGLVRSAHDVRGRRAGGRARRVAASLAGLGRRARATGHGRAPRRGPVRRGPEPRRAERLGRPDVAEAVQALAEAHGARATALGTVAEGDLDDRRRRPGRPGACASRPCASPTRRRSRVRWTRPSRPCRRRE